MYTQKPGILWEEHQWRKQRGRGEQSPGKAKRALGSILQDTQQTQNLIGLEGGLLLGMYDWVLGIERVCGESAGKNMCYHLRRHHNKFWKRETNAQARGKSNKLDKIRNNSTGKRLRDLETKEKFIDLLLPSSAGFP